MLWLNGGRLSGTGLLKLETGLKQNAGVLAPGNSPGTLSIAGNVAIGPGARFEAEIDGPGTANGAGNHDRLLVTGQYAANGQIAPILRGIGGTAGNSYSPALGQAFEVVKAAGGISGSFASLAQPTAGLLPGTRFDTVYGSQAITLYATPDRYANLKAAGVGDNYNRGQVGGVLDARRPVAGTRAADPVIKSLYDDLAPQTANTLPRVMDQLGGAGYAQLIHAGFENSKFLVEQTERALAAQRRGDPLGATNPQATSDPGRLVWGHAIGRIASQNSDGNGHTTRYTLGGLIGGMQKRLESGTVAGYSLAYANSSPEVKHDMGRGSGDTVQLMAYATKRFASGYFVQTTAGVGMDRIAASRHVDFTQAAHRATIRSTNAAFSGLAGWASGKAHDPRVEFTMGMRYMAARHHGFDDSNGQAASALSVAGGALHSFTASLGAGASLPFTARAVDWRASAWAAYSHELADTHASMDARLLNTAFNQRSGVIGRDKLTAGLALSGQVSQRTTIGLNIAGEAARNWRAASASLEAQIRF